MSRRQGEHRTPRSCVNQSCASYRVVRRAFPFELCRCGGYLDKRTAIRRKRPKRKARRTTLA